jgi:hypothetical protein
MLAVASSFLEQLYRRLSGLICSFSLFITLSALYEKFIWFHVISRVGFNTRHCLRHESNDEQEICDNPRTTEFDRETKYHSRRPVLVFWPPRRPRFKHAICSERLHTASLSGPQRLDRVAGNRSYPFNILLGGRTLSLPDKRSSFSTRPIFAVRNHSGGKFLFSSRLPPAPTTKTPTR